MQRKSPQFSREITKPTENTDDTAEENRHSRHHLFSAISKAPAGCAQFIAATTLSL